jgi:hypothetical protein
MIHNPITGPAKPPCPPSGHAEPVPAAVRPWAAVGATFIRTPGEAFDGDQVTLPCVECGLSEYSCECEIEADYPPSTKSREQIEADAKAAAEQFAKAFGIAEGWNRVEL